MRQKTKKKSKLREDSSLVADWLASIGWALAMLAAIVGFVIAPPVNVAQWTGKGFEVGGIWFAGGAISLYVALRIKKKRSIHKDMLVQTLAQAAGLSKRDFYAKTLEKASEPVRQLARRYGVSFTYETVSYSKHIVDMRDHDRVDFVEFRWVGDLIEFAVRSVNIEILKNVTVYLSQLRLPLAINEELCIVPLQPYSPSDEGLNELHTTLAMILTALGIVGM